VNNCPSSLAGCNVYDEAAAQRQILVFSRWATAKYNNTAEAWRVLTSNCTTGSSGVPWHLWPEVWADFLGHPSSSLAGVSWQPAFKYLDSNGDGQVSEIEFSDGCDHALHPSTTLSPEEEASPATASALAFLSQRRDVVLGAAIGVAVIVLLAAMICIFRRCRNSREDPDAARVMSKLSRDANEQVHFHTQEASAAKHVQQAGELEMKLGAGAGQRQDLQEKLWLFPSFGQGLTGLLQPRQESFRYGPLPLAEDPSQSLIEAGPNFSGSYPPSSLSVAPGSSLPGSLNLGPGSIGLQPLGFPPNSHSFAQPPSSHNSFHQPDLNSSQQLSFHHMQQLGMGASEAARMEAMRMANHASYVPERPTSFEAPSSPMAFFRPEDWDQALRSPVPHAMPEASADMSFASKAGFLQASVPVNVEIQVPAHHVQQAPSSTASMAGNLSTEAMWQKTADHIFSQVETRQ